MGRSSRCTGVNLVNHYRQSGIKHSISYTQLKLWEGPEVNTLGLPSSNKKYTSDPASWICCLRFDLPKLGEVTYYGCYKSQRGALEMAASQLQ